MKAFLKLFTATLLLLLCFMSPPDLVAKPSETLFKEKGYLPANAIALFVHQEPAEAIDIGYTNSFATSHIRYSNFVQNVYACKEYLPYSCNASLGRGACVLRIEAVKQAKNYANTV